MSIFSNFQVSRRYHPIIRPPGQGADVGEASTPQLISSTSFARTGPITASAMPVNFAPDRYRSSDGCAADAVLDTADKRTAILEPHRDLGSVQRDSFVADGLHLVLEARDCWLEHRAVRYPCPRCAPCRGERRSPPSACRLTRASQVVFRMAPVGERQRLRRRSDGHRRRYPQDRSAYVRRSSRQASMMGWITTPQG